MIETMFSDVLRDCQLRYCANEQEKADSWQGFEEDYLRVKLHEEICDWTLVNQQKVTEYNKLVDMILVALMLAQRVHDRLVEVGGELNVNNQV